MGVLIEEISLRDKFHIFKDRAEAGHLLSEKLKNYKGSGGIIMAIPSGGVPVASEISKALKLPLDLIIIRKIQIPYNPEAGFGAMGEDGEIIFNERLLEQLNLSEKDIATQVKKTMDVIKKRSHLFRKVKPFPDLKDRPVIIVDDGLASGYTMLASVRSIRKHLPLKIIVAVPTGSKNTIDFILPEADELVCLNIRSTFPFAVADAYRNWYDLSDEEVLEILNK